MIPIKFGQYLLMEIKKLDPKSNLQILENLSLEKYKRSDYHYTNKFELVGIVLHNAENQKFKLEPIK